MAFRHFAALLVVAAILIQIPAMAQDSRKDPARIGDRKVARGLNFYSIEQELALGKQLSLEVQKQARIVDDPIISEYVNRLGQNLGRNSDVTFPLSFKV